MHFVNVFSFHSTQAEWLSFSEKLNPSLRQTLQADWREMLLIETLQWRQGTMLPPSITTAHSPWYQNWHVDNYLSSTISNQRIQALYSEIFLRWNVMLSDVYSIFPHDFQLHVLSIFVATAFELLSLLPKSKLT